MQSLYPIFRTGIGQDSHRFLSEDSSKPCIIGGVIFEETPGLDDDSDGDVVFHAICHAISSVSGVQILNGIAKDLCRKDGITDSEVYLQHALKTLRPKEKIVHLAITIEGMRPQFEEKIESMRQKIAKVLFLEVSQVGITTTTGEGLTDFGCGDGVEAIAIVTCMQIP